MIIYVWREREREREANIRYSPTVFPFFLDSISIVIYSSPLQQYLQTSSLSTNNNNNNQYIYGLVRYIQIKIIE